MIFNIENEIAKANKAALVLINAGVAIGQRNQSSTAPNAKGEAKIGGVLYEVAAWTKKDKNGNPWQSLSFKAKE